jgi:DNA-binding protein YbaB
VEGDPTVQDDPVERLAELWDQTDVTAQKLAAAAQRGRTWTGADEAGSVTVSVDGTGHVTHVEVQPDWRQRIRGEPLGGAVRGAVEAAFLNRLRSWGEALAGQDAAPQPRARPMPLLHESLAYQLDELATARMSGDDGRAAMRELLQLLESVERDVDRVSEQLRVHVNALYTGYNPARDVAVTITGGGTVSEIRYNRHWLADARGPAIGRETVSAFRAAYREVEAASPDNVIARSALGEVQALGQDPFGLARRLHLRGD